MTILPLPAPHDPLPLAQQWLQEASASGRQRNPTAMALATSDARGAPAVRMVLLKHLALEQGYAVFYTHYGSRKAAELRHNPRAAAVLYWEELGRQMRLEGRIVQSPADESDRYFATRPWRSQLNAWVSEQSKPLADPLALEQRAARKARELGVPSDQSAGDGPRELPRPPFWGGYRLWLEALELWVEGTDRFHERLRYTRELVSVDQSSFRTGAWRHERLQP